MPGDEGSACACFRWTSRLLITAAFTALFLWLSLRTNTPTLSIERFALNATTTARNLTISFTLKLKNRNKDKAVFYDALNLTFYHHCSPVARATFPGFHQGRDKSAERSMEVEAVERNRSAVYRVELATAVRYGVVVWKTKRRGVEVGADLRVDGEGRLVRGKKGVKLTSAAGNRAAGAVGVACALSLVQWWWCGISLHGFDLSHHW